MWGYYRKIIIICQGKVGADERLSFPESDKDSKGIQKYMMLYVFWIPVYTGKAERVESF
jgi:hypothetical protein